MAKKTSATPGVDSKLSGAQQSTPVIGIVGAGQLARMLIQAAERLALPTWCLAENAQSPAALLAPGRLILGTAHDLGALQKLFAHTTHVIFENEFVDCALVSEAAEDHPQHFVPELAVLAQLQDKLTQKHILAKHKIPTAPFFEVPASAGVADLKKLRASLGGRCVLKWSRLGYDGKGVFFLDENAESLQRAEKFCQEAARAAPGAAVYAEARVDFTHELALVALKSVNGEFATYPLVESQQAHGICERVRGPAHALPGIPESFELQARDIAKVLVDATGISGAFAVEFFATRSGELWVNEIAPRVHNSGHYTQDAAATSQFENHLRAALGLKLGSTATAPAFVMINLLGPATLKGDVHPWAAAPKLPDTIFYHGYEKAQVRVGRKMGHLNGVARGIGDLAQLEKALESARRQWELDLIESEEKSQQ